jgi:hypothetical protein
MSVEVLLRRAALKATTLGAKLTDAERQAWEALDDYERHEYRVRASRQHEAQLRREIRRERHAGQASVLGRTAAPRRPTGHAPRRGRNPRLRGSRRVAGSRASPGGDEPPEADLAAPAFTARSE